MIKRSRSGKTVLITWKTGPPTLRHRQDNPRAGARHIPGWKPFFVGRHGSYVVHAYRPV